MVLAKSKNTVGLGNSLMNDRFGKGKASSQKKVTHNTAIARKGVNGETYITNPTREASWVKMRSITEQAALDEFLSTAELADTDFTAEKINNIKILHTDQKNPYLLSAAEEQSTVRKQRKNIDRLTIPRRPKWNERTTPQELDSMEKASLLEWRRGLAELQENQDLLMTPFERNLEVWRQLWRVIERSDLVVQIVDARNPLLYRSEDLEKYVKEVDPQKRNLLLVNKADMMTLEQREKWADYFEENNITYRFFSAELAKERNERLLGQGESNSHDKGIEIDLAKQTENMEIQEVEEDSDEWSSEEELDEEIHSSLRDFSSKGIRTRILDIDELEELFLANATEPILKKNDTDNSSKDKTIIGLVGYPNVGKSSTINALLGAKKVSVSATPGKTKHFQTLYLSPNLVLCDCPGLVFPNFATTKAELVVSGVLPIDQQREFTGPVGLVAQRIPKSFLEAIYGITIHTRPLEEGGTGMPTAHEVLRTYARARGFATTGQGQPDESRAARYILKDYVNGKLLFCHPPPASGEKGRIEGQTRVDPIDFNRELYDLSHLSNKRQAIVTRSSNTPSIYAVDRGDPLLSPTPSSTATITDGNPFREKGQKSQNLDKGFFGPSGTLVGAGHLTMPFSHKYSEQGRKELTGRKHRTMLALEKGIDPAELLNMSKKHFKGSRKARVATQAASRKANKDVDDF